MPETPVVRELQYDRHTRAYVHVTLETLGEEFTSTLGPLSFDEGWSVFQAFLADMKRLKPFA